MPTDPETIPPTREIVEEPGIAIDRTGFTAIRAHCVMDWIEVLAISPDKHGLRFEMNGPDGVVVLDADRVEQLVTVLGEWLGND